jgi:hypothetical protein
VLDHALLTVKGAASTGADDELDIFLRFLLRMSGPDAVGKQ